MVEQQSLLSRYRLDSPLAAGGMGTVYVATDERLNRRVAVKILKEDLAGDHRFVERFRREARAVASLSHPNIANVYDYGVDDRRHFIVMELVDGTDLSHVLRADGPLSPERATRIATQICAALGHAHAAGVVHRDVKPANVIVGDGDDVKVTDFGIARAVGDATLTATGAMLGTALYVSPEQAMGSAITAASDIYSTGIVFYEMLTGSIPFAGDSPVAIAMKHVSQDVPRPSEVARDVPRPIDDIVTRATSKNPRDRFANGQEMEGALRNSLRTTDPTAVPAAITSPLDRGEQSIWPIPGGRWDPRRVGRAVLLSFIALLLIASAALAWRLVTDEPDPPAGTGRDRNDASAPQQEEDTPSPDPTPSETTPSDDPEGFVIPEGIIGARAKDVSKDLEAVGISVVEIPVESDAPKDTIVEVTPPVGTEVFPGDTITLGVSTGKGDEEGDDDDD
jgi:serine/threonine protein kinase